MKTTKISVFAGVLGTTKAFDLTLEEVAQRLRTSYKAEIEHIRTLPKAEYDEAKKKLHAILFGGVAVNRTDNDIQEASGLMITDYDHLPDEDYAEIWELLKNDQHTVMLFRSPSGDGIKAVVRIPKSSKDDYRKRFTAYAEYINNPFFDIKNSNISRLCFVSYDPDLYVNWDAVEFEQYDSEDGFRYAERPAQIAITQDDHICERLLKWLDKKFPYSKGNRNDSIYKFAISCCDYGVNQEFCFDFTKSYIINDDFTDTELLGVIRSAYSRGNFNSKYFEDDRKRKLIVSAIKSKQPTDEIKSKYSITDEVLAEIMGNTTNDIFWTIDHKGKISIDSLKFKRFLEDSGFFKYFPEGALIPTFVKVKSNILSFSSAALIKEYILGYLEEKEPSVFNYCTKNSSMFTDQFLTLLKSIDVKILQDTKDAAFIPFQNGVLKVTKNSTQLISYIDIDGFIWERQIIQRNWRETEDCGNDFSDLCMKVCNNIEQRVDALSCALGYMIHSYKDKTHQKAVIFNDQEIDDNPNGGSGKSIMINALKAFKAVVVIDGKKYDNKSDFVYQRVSIDSQLLAFDDVRRNFNFEDLFPLITEGITVNRKNKDEIFIPFERSPKILITTNYIIKGIGHSHERRRHEIEFFQYFNAKRTPMQEYGRLLFDDWKEEDWAKFDNFMVFNLQNYLNNGLIAAPLENASRKRYIQETCAEFVEFIEDYDFTYNSAIYIKEIMNGFIQINREYAKLTSKKWGMWMDIFLKNDNREFVKDRDRQGVWIKLIHKDNEEAPF